MRGGGGGQRGEDQRREEEEVSGVALGVVGETREKDLLPVAHHVHDERHRNC